MNTSDVLTDFVVQLNDPTSGFPTFAPAPSAYSALASASAFPTLADFNASLMSGALKVERFGAGVQCTRLCQRVMLIRYMGKRLFCLSRKLMDPSVVLGHVVCSRKSCCKTLW